MSIVSNKFNVDSQGNMTCSSANINGGIINLESDGIANTNVLTLKLKSNTDIKSYTQPGRCWICWLWGKDRYTN